MNGQSGKEVKITRAIEIALSEYGKRIVIKTEDDGKFLGASVEALRRDDVSKGKLVPGPPGDLDAQRKDILENLSVSTVARQDQIKPRAPGGTDRDIVAAGHGSLLVTHHNPYCISYWDGRQWVYICYPSTAKC